jgi:hypothetical protein
MTKAMYRCALLLSVGTAMVSCGRDVETSFQIECGGEPNTAALRDDVRSTIPMLRLDGSGRPGDVPFVNIAGIVTDLEGDVYVLDAGQNTIYRFRATGELVNSFGRDGEGPGELRRPVAIGFVPPDTIRLFDALLWRITSYTTSGEIAHTRSPPAEARFGQSTEVRFGVRGELYHLSYGSYQDGLTRALGSRIRGLARGQNTIRVYNAEHDVWREIVSVEGLQVFIDMSEGAILDVPFARRALWFPGEAGVWHADTDEYQITLTSRGGEHLCAVRHDAPRVPVSQNARERFFRASDLEADQRFAGRLEQIRKERRRITLPETLPRLRELLASAEGRLWVLPFHEVPAQSGMDMWHVIDPGRSEIDVVAVPSALRPLHLRWGILYGVEVDTFGVQRVIGAEILPALDSLAHQFAF